jgi:4-diphosphocytidyl-2-C-methyl-D-erythritol kinase
MSSKHLRVKCYAKVNLGLQVLGKREDGYHDLRTVFQTVAVHDTLDVRLHAGPGGVELECDAAELGGPSNLAVRAAEAMRLELGLRGRVRLRLTKRIPWGAGLGGGSSDAAATLRAVAQLAGKPVPPERLLAVGARLGADVPFFLLGGRALGLGRGTEVFSLPDFPRRHLVLVFPGFPVNTAKAYADLDARSVALTGEAQTDRIYSFCASVWGRRVCRLENDFEAVVLSVYPQVARLKRLLTEAGASPALLSGSGSAVYGLFDSRQQAARAGKRVMARYPEWQVWVTRTVSHKENERQWKPIA